MEKKGYWTRERLEAWQQMACRQDGGLGSVETGTFQQLYLPKPEDEDYPCIPDFIAIEEVVQLWDVIGPLRTPVALGDIIDSNIPPLMMVTDLGNRIPAPKDRRAWALKFVKKCMGKPRLRYVSPCRVDSRLGWFVNELVKVREISQALKPIKGNDEFFAGFWDSHADWLEHDSVSPTHAAMLLCGHDPKTETVDSAARSTNEETTSEDFLRLKTLFEGAMKQERNLQEWADYAKEKGAKVHSWLERWRYLQTAHKTDKTEEPIGLSKQQILSRPWQDLPGIKVNLEAALSDQRAKWLKVAIVSGQKGKRGGPSTRWNPAKLALGMATQSPGKAWTVSQFVLTPFIKKNFNEYAEEWEMLREYL